jgi:histidinol-phosphate aminotransferase
MARRERASLAAAIMVGAVVLLDLRNGEEVARRLRAHGLAVRPAASVPALGCDHLRIAVRPPAENVRLVAALAEALA